MLIPLAESYRLGVDAVLCGYLLQAPLPSLQCAHRILTCLITVGEIFRWVVGKDFLEVIIISEEGMRG